jgi:hypothetical protein
MSAVMTADIFIFLKLRTIVDRQQQWLLICVLVKYAP